MINHTTRLIAWIAIIIWSIVIAGSLALGIGLYASTNEFRELYILFFMIFGAGIVFLLGWIMLLKNRIWAWRGLVALHIPILISLLYLIFVSNADGVLVMSFVCFAITFASLVTDIPQNWHIEKLNAPPQDSEQSL